MQPTRRDRSRVSRAWPCAHRCLDAAFEQLVEMPLGNHGFTVSGPENAFLSFEAGTE
jgi:hypothetical protein